MHQMSEPFQGFPSNEIEELDAQPQKGLNFRPYLRTFRRKLWLIAGITGLSTLAAALWSMSDPTTYIGSFYLLVEPITSEAKLANPTTLTRTEGVPNEDLFALDYPTNLVFLRSPGMTYKIAQEVRAKDSTKEVAAIWKDLRDNLTVERIGDTPSTATKIFEVTYKGENSSLVQSILDTAAEVYLKYSAEDRETSIKAGVKFIDKQLPELQQRLKTLQSQQQKLRQQYDLIDPTVTGQDLFARVSQLKEQQLETQRQLKAQKALYTRLQEQLQLTPNEALAAAALSQDPSRLSLLEQFQAIENQIALESTRFTVNNPSFQALREKRQNILNLLNQKTQQILEKNSIYISTNSSVLSYQDSTRLKLIEQLIETTNTIQGLEARNQSLIAARNTFEKQAKQFPAIVNKYNDIERQITLAKQVLDRLQAQRETLKVEAAQQLPWQLISKPQIPLDEKGKPIGFASNTAKKIALGLGGGLLLGIVLALLLEKRRSIFYSPEDIQDAFPIPVVGDIPSDERSQVPLNSVKNVEATVETESIEIPVLNSPFLDAFDSLYAHLSFFYTDPPLRSLCVCSVESQDGQSTVALHLAKTAAAAGKRVLLVDANLSNPQLHNWLNLPNYKGLSHVLTDNVAPEAVIEPVPQIDNLFCLSAGTSSSHFPQRLWSTQMQRLMEELQNKYDWVIYDPPHFLESTDVSFLAARTDGILLVVGVAKTHQSELKKALNQINTYRLPLLGIVANHPSATT